MSNSSSQSDRCNAETRDGGHCANYPVSGADRCRVHGGTNQGAPNPGANSETHGLTADRDRWFDRYRDEIAPVVRELVESDVADGPFGRDSTGKIDTLVQVVIDQLRLRESHEYLDEFLSEQVIAVADDGTERTQLTENPAHMPRGRIKRTNLRVLKQ